MENETGKRERNGYIQELRARGCKNAVLQLAAEDLEYGLTKEQIERYALKNWKMERIAMFSKALRMTGDEDFLSLLEDGDFNAEQMEVLLRFMEKGMPAKQMKDAADSNMNPHDIQKALQKVYEAAKEAEKASEKEPYFIRQVQERIQDMVDGIGANQNYLMKVMEKLNSIDQIQQESDDVRDSFAAVIEQKERELEEQQSSNNRLAVECAQLRTKCSALLEKQEEFEKEKYNLLAEKDALLREKDHLTEENESLRKAGEDLEKQIEMLRAGGKQEREKSEEDTGQTVAVDNADYVVPVEGMRQTVRVERTASNGSERLLALAGHRFFKGKGKISLIKQLTGKGLNQAQMEQIKVAIQSGLDEEEVIDIINSGFNAEEMAQAIEIVVADKTYQ